MNDPDALVKEILESLQNPNFKEYLLEALNDFYSDVYEEGFTDGMTFMDD